MRDSHGKELAVGDFVVYAGRGGSSCWVRSAQIVEIIGDKRPRLVVEVTEPQSNYVKQTDGSYRDEPPVAWRKYKTHTSVMSHLVKVQGFPQ